MATSPLGRRIAALRAARRMTQLQLAAAANASVSAIRKIEQGSRSPSDTVLSAIIVASAYGSAFPVTRSRH
ncbi:helix-turn-helix domain-containing protein [Thermomonospora amylolytica]|uniref:helix-turn-helix domain-containing protein n=1 Tax=Thermomonospora amylolytica TaxID=1411117 RepID=UPI000E6D574C|nr:helix-turn-helix domain-containing protein [Thermomonospora amylolytica]